MMTFKEYIQEKTDSWITVGSDEGKGRHVLISKEGKIKSGLGNKFNGKEIDDIYDKKFEKKAIEGWRVHEYAAIPKKINIKQMSAIMSYTGTMYREINNDLRKTGKISNSYQKEVSKRLDSVFKKSKCTAPLVVFRGVTANAFDKLEVGAVITDKAYMSTSSDYDVAMEFTRGEKGSKILEIRVPEGSRIMSVKQYSEHKSENELLIDRNSSYKVVEVKENDVIVELIQDE